MKFFLYIFIFEIIFIGIIEGNQNLTELDGQPFARIIGGYRPRNVTFAKHIVSIRYGHYGKVYGSNHLCAGSIISARIILTAGHCVYDPKKHHFRDKTMMTIVAGNTQRLKKSITQRTYEVEEIKLYPSYDYESSTGDLALLILNKPIEENGKTIERIPLADEKPLPGTKCIILGWGKILYNGPTPNELVFLNLTMMPKEDCVKFVDISKGIVCAGEEYFAERTAGSGDSGGPLICNGKIVGVASFIIPVRTYFTSVWHYRRWIKNNGVNRGDTRFPFIVWIAFAIFQFI